jgi:processing peptidase subunit beta
MVLAAAGGVDHDALVKTAEKLFSGLPSGNNAAKPVPARFVGSELRARDDTLPQAHIALAVEGVGAAHADFLPLMVASTIVGSFDRSASGSANLSSKLAQSASKTGLANSFSSFHTSYSDTGLWGTYAVCEHDTIEDFVYELQQEWMRISTNCTKHDVERAKNQLKASMLFQTDGTTAVCDEIGRQMLSYGRRMYAAELDARLDAINEKVVQAVANKHLFDKDVAVAGLGPIEQLTDYNRVRSGMFWLRV